MKRVVFSLLVLSGTAHAFPTGSQFDLDALENDGGGGIAFDGAPRFAGHTCAVCHTNAPEQIGSRIEADKVELFSEGWTPGQQYHLRVALLNAHAAAQYQAAGDNCGGDTAATFKPCDQNGFALEIADRAGVPKGKFVPVVNNACANGMASTDVDVYVLEDGTAVTHSGAHHGQLTWDFCWTAPAAGAGLLTAYLSVVDGNGGMGTLAFPADTIGDDVTSGAVPLPEVGGGAPPPQSGGCSTTEPGGSVLLALCVLVLVLRKRTRLALLLAFVVSAGCTHVRPRQRETLARKNMKFAPDPTEDELDLHMQEAREGSSGGYGSSGGGCGCN
ncbi:MAG TPA: DUF4266 domain-containing protein [Kofleriaceae bacterium]|nr:DUF4266 domain-containing protein [Kofleriaceae bacterium]